VSRKFALVSNLAFGAVGWALVSGLLIKFLEGVAAATILQATGIAFAISYALLVVIPMLISYVVMRIKIRKQRKVTIQIVRMMAGGKDISQTELEEFFGL
jgi:CBS domain containing-hemolysin-like protein